jgi:hypothetical protein
MNRRTNARVAGFTVVDAVSGGTGVAATFFAVGSTIFAAIDQCLQDRPSGSLSTTTAARAPPRFRGSKGPIWAFAT